MTAPAPELPIEELLAGYLSWQALDQLADAAAAAVESIWAMRGVLTADELHEAIVEVLVSYVVQGEALGRVRGASAQPVDGRTEVPNVVAEYARSPVDFVQLSDVAPPLPDEVYADPYRIDVRDDELRERLTKAVETILEPVLEQLRTPADDIEPPDEPIVDNEPDVDDRRNAVALERALDAVTVRLERIARDEPIQATQRGYQDGIRATKSAQGYRRRVNPDCCELCYWLWKEGYVYDIDQPMHRHTGCRCVPVPTSDPVGKWKLSPADEALFESLYEKYSTDSGGQAA